MQDFRPVRGLIPYSRNYTILYRFLARLSPRQGTDTFFDLQRYFELSITCKAFAPLGTVDGKKGCYTVIIHCVTALFGYVSIESILERLHVF